jgi:hypothetical protein
MDKVIRLQAQTGILENGFVHLPEKPINTPMRFIPVCCARTASYRAGEKSYEITLSHGLPR